MTLEQNEVYGLTGEVGKDGILSPTQRILLDEIQSNAATEALERAVNKNIDGKHPLVAMATGIGKGKIIHLAIDRLKTKKPDAKILVVA